MGWLINDCDKCYVDRTYIGLLEAAGIEVQLYSLKDRIPDDRPNYDPLYGEPLTDRYSGDERFQYDGPYTVLALVKRGSTDVDATEFGETTKIPDGIFSTSTLWLTENEVPRIKEGDVIEWEGDYYSIFHTHSDGFRGPSDQHVRLRCDGERADEFLPRRLVDQ